MRLWLHASHLPAGFCCTARSMIRPECRDLPACERRNLPAGEASNLYSALPTRDPLEGAAIQIQSELGASLRASTTQVENRLTR